MIDCLSLDLVDDLVDGGLVGRAGRAAAQDLSVDDERHLGEMRFGGALVMLTPELDRRIRLIVEEPFDPPEFPFRVLADAVRDLGVLALDDRPHANLPGRGPVCG